MSQYHTPVLLKESVGLLGIDPAGTYVDLTFGGGGHSRRILEELGPEGRLYAFDQDRDTLANAPADGRFHWPSWESRRAISTPWNGVFRSGARRRWTCA